MDIQKGKTLPIKALFLAQFFKSVQEKGLFTLICFKYLMKLIAK